MVSIEVISHTAQVYNTDIIVYVLSSDMFLGVLKITLNADSRLSQWVSRYVGMLVGRQVRRCV